MKHPALPTKHEIDAFVAPCFALIGWLFQLIVCIGAPHRSKRLKRAIAYAERAVQHLVFLWAFARMGPITPRTRRPLNAPTGFRRAKRDRRLCFRYARIALRGGSFFQRVARLISVLANPERYIARFVALMMRGLRATALIAAAPPASAFASAAAPPPSFTDSS